MPGVMLWGWDSGNSKWVKVLVNSEGKLIIDPTEIFTDTPADGETGKAPTSNWAYDEAVARAAADYAEAIARAGADSTEATARAAADLLRLLLAGGTMSGAIAMGGYKVTGLGTPASAGDALRKGTRVTVAELPALTDEKIWKGTGGDVEEIDVPVGGIPDAAVGNAIMAGCIIISVKTMSLTTYTIEAELTIGVAGALRIKFNLKASVGPTAYGRIYRNDVAVGTEQTTTSTTYVTFSEDITGWSIGDKVQLYIKSSASGQGVSCQALKLYVLKALAGVITFGTL